MKADAPPIRTAHLQDEELKLAVEKGWNGRLDIAAEVICKTCRLLLADIFRHGDRVIVVDYDLDPVFRKHRELSPWARSRLHLTVDGTEYDGKPLPRQREVAARIGTPRWRAAGDTLDVTCPEHGHGSVPAATIDKLAGRPMAPTETIRVSPRR